LKIARFEYNDDVHYGAIEGDVMRLLSGSIFCDDIATTDTTIPLNSVRLLAPVIPGKVVCVGLNYKDHAKEMGMPLPDEPVLFLKPSTAVIGPSDNIIYPQNVKRLDYEAELALVIKATARDVREDEAGDHILGYTCLNDVTARDLQKKDIQWTRAKSFDTFCPLGPCIATDADPQDLEIALFVNNKLRQSSTTANLIFSPEFLVSFISGVMTLLPGDIIATGTPPGIGPL